MLFARRTCYGYGRNVKSRTHKSTILSTLELCFLHCTVIFPHLKTSYQAARLIDLTTFSAALMSLHDLKKEKMVNFTKGKTKQNKPKRHTKKLRQIKNSYHLRNRSAGGNRQKLPLSFCFGFLYTNLSRNLQFREQ